MIVLQLLESVKDVFWSALIAGQSTWSQIPEVARSLLSAGVGVLFGAWIASRAQSKRTIVSELHALRSAHALCFSIVNKALSMKKQQVRPLRVALNDALAVHAAYVQNPQGFLLAQLDLRTMSQVKFPSQALEKLILERCFLGSEATATLVAVMDATEDLRQSLDLRNELVTEFRKNPPAEHLQRVERYLGLPTAEGHRDERIKSNILALYAQTDDCIFFARRLNDHILHAENRLRRSKGWKYWLPGRKLKPIEWTKAEDLLPLDSAYKAWTSGFVKDQSWIERVAYRLKQLVKPKA